MRETLEAIRARLGNARCDVRRLIAAALRGTRDLPVIDQRQRRARFARVGRDIERGLQTGRRQIGGGRITRAGARPRDQHRATIAHRAQRLRDVVAHFVIVDPFVDNAQRPELRVGCVKRRAAGAQRSSIIAFPYESRRRPPPARSATTPAATGYKDATAHATHRACRPLRRCVPTSSRSRDAPWLASPPDRA